MGEGGQMVWWMWVFLGLACLVAEVLLPGGIFMLFFGTAALLLGGLVAAGLGGPIWLQWGIFSILSVVSLLTLRSPLLRWVQRGSAASGEIDSLLGKTVLLVEDLGPGAEGKAEFRGTSWTARNVGDEPLARGDTCAVVQVDGLKLLVRRKHT